MLGAGSLQSARRLEGALDRPVARKPGPTGWRPGSSEWAGWVPLAVFSAAVLALRSQVPAWAFMWALGLGIYGGFKWLTWWRARGMGARPGMLRTLGYLLLWPGMDARAFLHSRQRFPEPPKLEWALAIGKTAVGAVLFWGGSRFIPPELRLLVGWSGLVGLIFLLHFGAFHIAALAWQAAGVEARPMMRAPALATSLSDFWSIRWNLAFRQLAHALILRPLRHRLGVVGGALAVFLASGLLHEVVISLPAGGGYGLPTAYFTLQALAMFFERSRTGRRLGLGRGFRGWLFTALVTAGPAFCLFHPPFVTRVVLPFMKAVGAL